MMTSERVKELVRGHSLIREIDYVPKGHMRIETAFLYPDGSSIEVFVPQGGSSSMRLSDMGQTMSLLMDMQVKPWMSKKRSAQLEDAIRPYGVNLNGAALEVPVSADDGLPEAMIRLGQACLRASDLLFTRRTSLQNVFTDEVEEVLVDAELTYQQNVERMGRGGKLIRVDFVVQGKKTESSVLTLAAGQNSQAHIAANEVFRKWYDLFRPDAKGQRVTIFDDRVSVYKAEDLERLQDFSTVVGLSDRQAIRDLLAA